MPQQPHSEDWLARYASNYHAWKKSTLDGEEIFKRPLGLVEYSFDTDGTDFEGRADMNALLGLEIGMVRSNKEKNGDGQSDSKTEREEEEGEQAELKRRITLAWASLRLQHVMLGSRSIDDGSEGGRRSFVVRIPKDKAEAITQAMESIVWVRDLYREEEVDVEEVWRHCRNVGRMVVPEKGLAKLHVLPLRKKENESQGGIGRWEIKILITMAHQISDGLTSYNWVSNFIRILNQPAPETEKDIELYSREQEISKRLPPAQEDLYPPIPGSKARQRWFWVIMRILRHTRRELPQTFINPLRLEHSLPTPISLPATFDKIFDYTEHKRPPNNAFVCQARLSKPVSSQLIHLCRSNNISVGAATFALTALSMMELEEQRHPNIPHSERRPFVTSFPLNPRLFFGYNQPADSCMLAFSDGIVLPFLPSHLPLQGRFLLIAKAANRQLRVYQKRAKKDDRGEAAKEYSIDSHSSIRLLANGYLESFDRIESKLPPHKRSGLTPQGAYPPQLRMWGATCGISSMGSVASYVRRGMYDLETVGIGEGKNTFVADFREYRMGVRARENEFLVGSSTNGEGVMEFLVSHDGSAIPEEAAKKWAEKIEGLFGDGEKANL